MIEKFLSDNKDGVIEVIEKHIDEMILSEAKVDMIDEVRNLCVARKTILNILNRVESKIKKRG